MKPKKLAITKNSYVYSSIFYDLMFNQMNMSDLHIVIVLSFCELYSNDSANNLFIIQKNNFERY